VKREPLTAYLKEVRLVVGGSTLVASPATRGEVQPIPRERSLDRKVLWEAYTPGGRFQVVLIRGKGAFLASYSGPRAHYLRLDPAQVGGLVGALWEVLGREEEEEYLDIDTTRQGSQGWPYGHLGALLALMGGAFRQDPELGRRVVEAALKAYTADLCSSLRAEPGGGGKAGGGSPFLSEGASSSHHPPRPDEALCSAHRHGEGTGLFGSGGPYEPCPPNEEAGRGLALGHPSRPPEGGE
jgi:hypothetical protein